MTTNNGTFIPMTTNNGTPFVCSHGNDYSFHPHTDIKQDIYPDTHTHTRRERERDTHTDTQHTTHCFTKHKTSFIHCKLSHQLTDTQTHKENTDTQKTHCLRAQGLGFRISPARRASNSSRSLGKSASLWYLASFSATAFAIAASSPSATSSTSLPSTNLDSGTSLRG